MAGLTRRFLLAGAAASGAAPAMLRGAALPVSRAVRSAGAGKRDYAAALDAIADQARADIAAWPLPGMTLCVADADGFAAVMSFGYANVDQGVAVTPRHLFQIGSISKSFAAICLLGFVDEGKLDLDAPVSRYLPAQILPPEPITTRQLLCHSTGLPDNSDIVPRVPGERLWTGYAPGTRFSYSNTGYQLLGLLIGKLGGAPHPEVIRRRVLEPLGMRSTLAAIFDPDRAAYATGYVPLIGSRPYVPGQPLSVAGWSDFEGAAGSIASTPDDMIHYLRLLLAAGAGKPVPLLSAASARTLTTATIDADEFGPKARYGAGIATVIVDGKPCLHHTGGMDAFSSSFHVDPAAGVACFASVNVQLGNGYRPRLVTAHAVELLRAARGGGTAPAAPDPLKAVRVQKPELVAGHYVAADGRTLDIAADGATLAAGGTTGKLFGAGPGTLVTDHPAFAAAGFNPVKKGDAVTGLWWRDTLFGKGAAAVQPPVPPRLRALAGTFEDPTGHGSSDVYARGDRLVSGGGDVWIERAGGWWSAEDDAGGVERIRFEAPIEGRPYRINFSGWDLLRRETG